MVKDKLKKKGRKREDASGRVLSVSAKQRRKEKSKKVRRRVRKTERREKERDMDWNLWITTVLVFTSQEEER